MSEVKEENEPIAFEQDRCDASIDMVTIPLKALEDYISSNISFNINYKQILNNY
jgi:hypothetical protein